MKNEIESAKAQITYHFNNILKDTNRKLSANNSAEATSSVQKTNKRAWTIVDSNTERVVYVDVNSVKFGPNDRVYFTMKVRRRDDGTGNEQDRYIDPVGYVNTLAVRMYDSNWVLKQEIVDGSKFKSVKIGTDEYGKVYNQVMVIYKTK